MDTTDTDTDRPIQRGDLRIVNARPTPRIVLICDPSHASLWRVALVHSSAELATGHDTIVEPSTASVTWPVVVQADLQGAVPSGRIGDRVGTVRLPVAGLCGSRLGGPLTDRRWAFKTDEGQAMSTFALGLDDVLSDR